MFGKLRRLRHRTQGRQVTIFPSTHPTTSGAPHSRQQQTPDNSRGMAEVRTSRQYPGHSIPDSTARRQSAQRHRPRHIPRTFRLPDKSRRPSRKKSRSPHNGNRDLILIGRPLGRSPGFPAPASSPISILSARSRTALRRGSTSTDSRTTDCAGPPRCSAAPVRRAARRTAINTWLPQSRTAYPSKSP